MDIRSRTVEKDIKGTIKKNKWKYGGHLGGEKNEN